jgi:hypothetical protein
MDLHDHHTEVHQVTDHLDLHTAVTLEVEVVLEEVDEEVVDEDSILILISS